MSSPHRKALRLLRISDARDDDTAGVDRQDKDTLALCDRVGWDDGGVYLENDTSAFKRKRILLPDGSYGLRTVRPEFRRLVADLAAGVGTAIAAYDLDRVARDPRDLEDLIDVVEATGVPAKAVTGSIDLSTDAGITMARVMVAFANKTSRDTRRRVARVHDDLAEAGQYGGGGRRPFGWQSDGVTAIPEEIEAIEAMAALYLEKSSLSEIARKLDAAGVAPVAGGRWNVKSIATILKSPRIAGLRQHRGEVVGPAVWDAALPREQWENVQDALAERVTLRPKGFQRWLTGTLFCGRPGCGHRVRGWTSRGVPIYWCPNLEGDRGCGRLSCRARPLEDRAEELVFAALADPANLAALNSATNQDSTRQARRDAADDETQLKELAAMWGRRDISMPEYLAARKEINDRLKQARAVVAASIPASARRMVAGDMGECWASFAPIQRREVVQTVFPDGLWLMPVGPSGPVFNPDRLQVRRPEGA